MLKNSENLGISETREVGVKIATKEFICFLDGDDLIDLDVLLLQIDQLKIDYEAKLAKQQLDDKLSYDMLDTRYRLDVEMYTSMINNRNDLLFIVGNRRGRNPHHHWK